MTFFTYSALTIQEFDSYQYGILPIWRLPRKYDSFGITGITPAKII